MCELLYLMVQSDGVLDENEHRALRGVARTLSDGVLSKEQIDGLLAQFSAQVSREGHAERLLSVTETLSADKFVAESAFTLAASMALPGSEMGGLESSQLGMIAAHLGISKQRAAELAPGLVPA